jgi:hypothetical protein
MSPDLFRQGTTKTTAHLRRIPTLPSPSPHGGRTSAGERAGVRGQARQASIKTPNAFSLPHWEVEPRPAFPLRNLFQRTMKPSDPCELPFPLSLRLGLQIERMFMTRPVPQWLLRIPRPHSWSTSRSPSGLRALIHTPDTPTYPTRSGGASLPRCPDLFRQGTVIGSHPLTSPFMVP